jgi:hypothetical protein
MAGMGSNPAFSEKLISLSLQNQIHMMIIDDMLAFSPPKPEMDHVCCMSTELTWWTILVACLTEHGPL